jgi:methionyl-tRNA synthetase
MSDSSAPGSGITIEEFARVSLVVGEVREVLPHPRADKLLLLKVDTGGEQPIQLVAGLKLHYQPEDLVGRQVVVVANLAPARLRGELSEGMVLAAVTGEDQPVLLTVDRPVPNGSSVR